MAREPAFHFVDTGNGQMRTRAHDALKLTDAERTAGVTPVNYAYDPVPIDVRRYGALGDGSTDDTAACTRAISVLASTTGGELYFPAGYTFNVSQLLFSSLSNFGIRVDGIIQSNAAQPGTAFTDERGTYAGTYSVLKFDTCSNFYVYGSGYVQNGYVEPLYMLTCTDFDWSLDLRGDGTNSTLSGVALRYCGYFCFHDMTVDSVTAQDMHDALTVSGAFSGGETSATMTSWSSGAGTFNVRFSNGDLRLVTFGSGTSNVSMTWTGGLSGAATVTVYAEVYYSWSNNFQIWDCSSFILDKVASRHSGMNGINPSSNCTDFTIQNCVCEFNSGSGIQVSWASFGNFPSRFKILGNLLRFNQADGIDCFNGSGVNPTAIYAVIANNLHVQNGWINCDPANPSGADGSGIGTFIYLADFTAYGNVVHESSNSAAYVQGCSLFQITNNVVQKDGGGNVGFGIHLNDCTDGVIADNVVKFTAGEALGLVNTSTRLTIQRNRFLGKIDTSLSLSVSGCTFENNKVQTADTVTALMPFRGNAIVYSGTGTAVVLGGDDVTLDADSITATTPGANAVTATSRTACAIRSCIIQANSYGVSISGGAANCVESNYIESLAQPVLNVAGSADRTVIKGNRLNATGSAHAINIDASGTKTSIFANKIVAGTTNYGGTYEINYP